MTLAELYKWPIERNFSPERRSALDRLLGSYVVLPFDDALARRWAELSIQLKRAGRGISDSDAWIAATALLYDAPLLTHNKSDYLGVPGLRFSG